MVLILLVACTGGAVRAPDDTTVEVTIADLWDGRGGDAVTIGPVVVTSPRTTRQSFFVQDPAGGPRSGLEVELFGLLNEWPPPIGTEVRLAGIARNGSPPSLELSDTLDGEVLGSGGVPVGTVLEDDISGTVLRVDLTVTSPVDPSGEADSDPGGVGALFGVVPPDMGSSGALTGVVADGRLHPRQKSDWVEVSAPDEAPTDLTLGEAADAEEGGWVRVEGTQITPWSRDGRWTVLQDDEHGLWVDREAFAVVGAPGQRVRWEGEVRDGHLRTWWDAEDQGPGDDARIGGDQIGDVVEITVAGLQPPDPLGERAFADGVLDDRFVDLTDLEDGITVTAAVWADGIYAVLP